MFTYLLIDIKYFESKVLHYFNPDQHLFDGRLGHKC